MVCMCGKSHMLRKIKITYHKCGRITVSPPILANFHQPSINIVKGWSVLTWTEVEVQCWSSLYWLFFTSPAFQLVMG